MPPVIITREDWKARNSRLTLDPGPEERVVFHHAPMRRTFINDTMAREVEQIKVIERHHIDTNGWAGLGYNFLAAQSGRLYEGRGWRHKGAHAGFVNGSSIGICLLLDGQRDEPSPPMIAAIQDLLMFGVTTNELLPSFIISGHRDHRATTCPGDLVYNLLHQFRPDNRPAVTPPVYLSPTEAAFKLVDEAVEILNEARDILEEK